jgi:hypothetical protein
VGREEREECGEGGERGVWGGRRERKVIAVAAVQQGSRIRSSPGWEPESAHLEASLRVRKYGEEEVAMGPHHV